METLMLSKFGLNENSKKNFAKVALSIIAVAISLWLTKSILLGSLLGVSFSTAYRIVKAAYTAYRAGASIRAAVAAFTGWGFLLDLAIDFLIGWGIGYVLGSSWLISA